MMSNPEMKLPPLPPWLTPHFPLDRRVEAVEDLTGATRHVHLVDHGPREAPVALMIHGNPTWSFLWRRVIERLPRLRCVAPDLIGLGLSEKPRDPGWHTVAQHVHILDALVTRLQLRRVILVAQDWGGPFAVGLAARRPELVEGVVLGNTAIATLTRKSSTAFHRFARTPILSDLVFRGLGFPQGFMGPVQGDRRSISGVVSRAYRYPLRDPRDRVAPLALARLVPDGPEHPTTATLAPGYAWARGFAGPAALVWGTRDPILRRALTRTRETFRDVTVTETQAGHFLQEEVPDELAAAIEDVRARAAQPT